MRLPVCALAILAAGFVSVVGGAAELNPVRTHPHADPQSAIHRIIVKLRASSAATTAATTATSRLQTRATADRVANLAARVGVTVRVVRAITADMQAMQVEPAVAGEGLATTLARLRADPDVEYADADQRRYIHAVPNDPLYSTQQWYMQKASAIPSAVNAEGAWDTTTGSAGLVIADLDTGVRFDHPDLLWAGAGSGGRLLPGFDFIEDSFVANDGDGWDADPSDPGDWVTSADLKQSECANTMTASNSSWHGTRTAGMLGALTNNGAGVAGMTWSAWILPVRVLGKCGGLDSDIMTGMLWAAGVHVAGAPDNPYPARIVNLSLGGTGVCPQFYVDTIQQLSQMGVLVVASAGNEGGPVDAPANCPGVVGVAGLRHAGTKVGFSSLGPELSLGAPGGNCVNTTAGAACLFSIGTSVNLGVTTPGPNSYTDQFANSNLGTSFSAPIVSGIAGLMLSVNGNLRSAQLTARLKEGALAFPQTSIGETTQPPACHVPTGPSDVQNSECICTTDGRTCGAGMANAAGALAAALRPIAAARIPASVMAGLNVSVDASGSAAACGHSVSSYQWVSSDPTHHPVTSASGATTTVVAPSSGSFTIMLTVMDDAGKKDTANIVVSANSTSTSATASAGSNACLKAVTVASPITVSVQPSSATVPSSGRTQSFAATVTHTLNTTVTWQVNGVSGGNTTVGMISSAGLYTAPATTPASGGVTVTAVSAANSTRSASAKLSFSAPVTVMVSPTSASVAIGTGTQAFKATVTNTTNQAVSWKVAGVAGGNATVGTISSAGIYTAPAAVPSPSTVTVTAASVADPTRTASAQVTVDAVASAGKGGGGALDELTLICLSGALLAAVARPRRRVAATLNRLGVRR
ncbi:MAG TPA: S8 family peptidase [Steroidobacteraceae bacterium]